MRNEPTTATKLLGGRGGGRLCQSNENFDKNLTPLATVFPNDILKSLHNYISLSLI